MNLKNHFLIAMPDLEESPFDQAVVLMVDHNDEGAMGLVLNQPGTTTRRTLFEKLSLPTDKLDKPEQPVLLGGPVAPERGFVLHDGSTEWDNTFEVTDNLKLTTSTDILDSIAQGEGPANWLFALGYAGWDAGQLEDEIRQNAWLTSPADHGLIFEQPLDKRWQLALAKLGVQPGQITAFHGNA
jgi:putative transcriptional regulator